MQLLADDRIIDTSTKPTQNIAEQNTQTHHGYPVVCQQYYNPPVKYQNVLKKLEKQL